MQVLAGLRADNLLGYLAALGVCRLTGCRLSWTQVGPLECAALDTSRALNDVVDELVARCRNPPIVAHCSHPNLVLGRDEWAALPDEWAATIACETAARFARSPLLTCGSSGRQLTTIMVELSKAVTAEDIRAAFEGPWIYRARFGLQWDPAEFRVAGERWMKPAKEKSQVAWGATRLAIEGLPLWPTLTAKVRSVIRYVTWGQPLGPLAVRGRILSGVGDRVYECDRVAGSKGRVSFDASRVAR